MAEADNNQQITRSYVHGLGLTSMIQGTQTYHYHHSATGHTLAITDSNETIINQYAYSPYGRILGETETAGLEQPFKYVGKYGVQHEGNELYYMRARYYDAKTGRLLKEDPIGIEGGLNVSLYVDGNPITYIDPMGLTKGGKKNIGTEGFNTNSDPTEVQRRIDEVKKNDPKNTKRINSLRGLLKVIKRGGKMGLPPIFCVLCDQLLNPDYMPTGPDISKGTNKSVVFPEAGSGMTGCRGTG